MVDDVRLIAFYLPQYHAIAENDAWWGEGYTEWTRVVEARPSFHGHHQPQLPGALGFYDLRLPEAREAQARLARRYGIHGFCYYHYWFNGKRLLERPFDEVLASGQPDFPFCLCWANENWTRRWDGLSKDVLMAQHHSPEDDRALFRDLLPALRDPRYIRVNGRPLLLVYLTQKLPNPAATAAIWREEAAAAGLPGLYLCRVESFQDPTPPPHPETLGFDATCEFPPHRISLVPPQPPVSGLDPGFCGVLYDYAEVARYAAASPQPPYRRFHGVMPSWDNTARTGPRARIAVNSGPEAYKEWLETMVNRTRREFAGDERIVFVNAWNEWGEGCHLEPDRVHGYAWLEATRAALGINSEVDPGRSGSTASAPRVRTLTGNAAPEPPRRHDDADLIQRLNAKVAGRDAIIAGLKDKIIRGAAAAVRRNHRAAARIRVVCATREDRDGFFSATALGKSLNLHRPSEVEVRLFPQNAQGLPAVYNTAITESAGDDVILLFVHDDIHLCDFHWAERLREALTAFDVVGLAGNRRRVPRQPGWRFIDEKLTSDSRDNLSGKVGHGNGYPATSISAWSPSGEHVKLLDGLFIAARSKTLRSRDLRFDERFEFHFYDLDFCRQAEQAGLRMGTWPISVIHESGGKFTGDGWQRGYETYLEKWRD
ncbi:MAG TPA: glycoside hydrolase family 99-like domain-containing protein [Steroidobacteraceae bacterium]|nr:glycoside hydrolase family 99-like domain-containing protein [Steroidobacteraceae bacterium]